MKKKIRGERESKNPKIVQTSYVHGPLGMLGPEEFCPNKAEKSLEYLAKQEAERSEKAEVRTGWSVRFVH